VGYACRINGGTDAQPYTSTSILGDEFLQTLACYNLKKEEITFQQDNDSKHTSRIAR